MVNALNHVLPVLIPVAVVLLFADLLWAFATFDQLVKLEFQDYPEDWQKDGKPPGFFWRGPKSFYTSWQDRYRAEWHKEWLSMAWTFYTPAWARSDAEARGLLARLRLLVAIWNLSILLPLIAAIIASAFHLL